MADPTEARRLADESDITELVRMDVETAKAAGLSVMRLKHEEASHLLSTIDSLRNKHDSLKAELITASKQIGEWVQIAREVMDEHDSLRAQVEALRADAERLEWLNENPRTVTRTAGYRGSESCWTVRNYDGVAFDFTSLRNAIDAARSQEAAG